jgi:hypothetical protein
LLSRSGSSSLDGLDVRRPRSNTRDLATGDDDALAGWIRLAAVALAVVGAMLLAATWHVGAGRQVVMIGGLVLVVLAVFLMVTGAFLAARGPER